MLSVRILRATVYSGGQVVGRFKIAAPKIRDGEKVVREWANVHGYQSVSWNLVQVSGGDVFYMPSPSDLLDSDSPDFPGHSIKV